MLKKVRKGVFETNSSSMHSICISGKDRLATMGSGGEIIVDFDGYGWGYDELTSSSEKLSYVLTSLQYYCNDIKEEDVNTLRANQHFKWLSEMVRDYTGNKLVLGKSLDSYYPMGYIDHQSVDTLDEYWSEDEYTFKDKIKDLVFNDKYSIIIDNDNH